MKYHLCCNQRDHIWEVRDEQENVVYSGQRFECVTYKRIREYEDEINDGEYE
ncbi:MAG: hypothetical protein ACI33I_09320 [Clostridium sp.]